MIENYIKIAWRNLGKNKVFSLINITGLAISMTACFFIFKYVYTELNYDRFHSKGDRIYRLATDIKLPQEIIHEGASSSAMAFYMAEDFPEIEQFVRFSPISLLVRKDDIKFQEVNTFFVDSSVFSVFDFPLIKGDFKTALKDPFTMVISKSVANKYFGDEDPIGKTLLVMESAIPVKVTGVMDDLPVNSSIKASIFVSLSTNQQIFGTPINDSWGNFSTTSFLVLRKGTDVKQLEKKLPAFLLERIPSELQQTEMSFSLFLEPLKEIYLHSDRVVNRGFESGNINNVYIFSIVAFFILFIACINFINLATARAVERGKEVGIRKVTGAYRSQIIVQFMGETLLISTLAFFLTCLLIKGFIPWFNQIAGKTIVLDLASDPSTLVLLFFCTLGTGLLAGIYPTFVLSAFKPIIVLRGRFRYSNTSWLRKALVVIQFTVSVTLILVTFIVYHQLYYMRNEELGFNKSQILILEIRFDSKQEALKTSLSAIPAVQSTSLSGSIPGGDCGKIYAEIENNQGNMQATTLDLYTIDEDFIPLYEMKLISGRSFSKEFGSDSSSLILNESASKLLGYTSSNAAVGHQVRLGDQQGTIVGVVQDFHFKALKEQIRPLGIRLGKGRFSNNYISIKIETGDLSSTMNAIENKWHEIIPNRPFRYFFADDFFDRQYRDEKRFGQLFFYFTVLAIFISCLGLFALVAYSTLKRQKEIGVRKILGASVIGIIKLLSADFVKLVLLSSIIASPVTWWVMNQWLENFAYRIEIKWWMFVLSGTLAIVVALLTLGFQAVKAAVANPVNSLRDE